METTPSPSTMEIIQKRLDDLEHYVLTLERKIVKLNSSDRVIVEDVHCLIRFFKHVCKCCTDKEKTTT